MEMKQTTIYFKHWKTGEQLVETGELLSQYNNSANDRYVLKTENGLVDIIKSTVIKIDIGIKNDFNDTCVKCRA
jgi:hypothetical protein